MSEEQEKKIRDLESRLGRAEEVNVKLAEELIATRDELTAARLEIVEKDGKIIEALSCLDEVEKRVAASSPRVPPIGWHRMEGN